MRIGVISDIHSNLAALRAVLRDMPRVDEIICMGDLVGYGAEPNKVIKVIRSKGIRSVMGNHDYATVTGDISGFNDRAANAINWTLNNIDRKNLEYLATFPTHLEFKIGGHRIYMVHGSPRNPLNEYVFPDFSNRDMAEVTKGADADLVLLGHTHMPMKRMIMGKLVVNPGGVGQPRDRDPRASYALLNFKKELEIIFMRVGYNVDATAAKIKAAGLPEELATRLYFGW